MNTTVIVSRCESCTSRLNSLLADSLIELVKVKDGLGISHGLVVHKDELKFLFTLLNEKKGKKGKGILLLPTKSIENRHPDPPSDNIKINGRISLSEASRLWGPFWYPDPNCKTVIRFHLAPQFIRCSIHSLNTNDRKWSCVFSHLLDSRV